MRACRSLRNRRRRALPSVTKHPVDLDDEPVALQPGWRLQSSAGCGATTAMSKRQPSTNASNKSIHLVCMAATPVVAASKAYDAEFVAQQTGKGSGTLAACWHYLRRFGVSGLPPNRSFDPLRYVARNQPFAPGTVHPLISHILYGERLGYDPAGNIWGCAGFAAPNEPSDAALPLRLAAHAHIYHCDLVPEIAARLSRLPSTTAIFVTTVLMMQGPPPGSCPARLNILSRGRPLCRSQSRA